MFYLLEIFKIFLKETGTKECIGYGSIRHTNSSVNIVKEKQNQKFLLDIQIMHEEWKYTISVYHKLASSGFFTKFDIFLKSSYGFMLPYSDWTELLTDYFFHKKKLLNLQATNLCKTWYKFTQFNYLLQHLARNFLSYLICDLVQHHWVLQLSKIYNQYVLLLILITNII